MKLTIYRGTREIGGNVVEVSANSTRIVIDVGLPLVNEDREPFDQSRISGKDAATLVAEGIAPHVDGLFLPGKRVDAILLSHSHLDHVGMLPYTHEAIPVFATAGTSKLMHAMSLFANRPELPRERFQCVTSGRPFAIGDIQITPFAVDHNCFGSVAYLIESGGKRLLYSGDVRLHGRKPGMMKSLMVDVGPLRVDALVMEGTHLGNHSETRKTEYELQDEITESIKGAQGLVLASFSPMDIDRLVSYLNATVSAGRTLVVDAYAAYVMYLVHTEIAIPHPLKTSALRIYFNQAFLNRKIAKLQRMFLSARIDLPEITAKQNEFVMLFRPNMMKLDFGGCLPEQVRCLYSYWQGYLDRTDWIDLKAEIETRKGSFVSLHTSGHIFEGDLVKFVQAIDPKRVIPIHTFAPERFQDHFSNVELLADGQTFEI